jgi:hypothetical protein
MSRFYLSEMSRRFSGDKGIAQAKVLRDFSGVGVRALS